MPTRAPGVPPLRGPVGEQMLRALGLLAATLSIAVVAFAVPAVAKDVPPPLASKEPAEAADFVAKYAGWTVWSESESSKDFILYARHAGTTTILPAPPSAIAHDPGVGRGPTGRPTAVYQRCAGVTCSIWELDLASTEQHAITGLGAVTRGARRATDEGLPELETHPRIWNSTVAFRTGALSRSRVRIGPAAPGGPALRSLRTSTEKGALTQLALGPQHIAALFYRPSCSTIDCAHLTLFGLASGVRRQLAIAADGKCDAILSDVMFRGGAFLWSLERTPEDSGDTLCDTRIRHYAYSPATGKTTRR